MPHIEYDGEADRDAYQVRRISPADGSLDDPFLASDISASIFGTITADSAGGLTAVWTDDGDEADVRSSYSATSAGFTPPHHTPKCTTSVPIKAGVVAAVLGGGCFDEGPQGSWSTSGDVNVNGIRFVGSKGSTKVTINTKVHTITATAGVVQSAGPIIFSKDPGTWDLDGTTTFEGLEKFGIKLFDFKALGQASVTFANGEAKVQANLALPRPFDVVTGGTTLTTTTKKGLSLVGISLHVPSLDIGIFALRNLAVTYDASSSTFTGHVDLKLPPSGEWSSLTVGFRQGKLVRLALKYGGPPFPPEGPITFDAIGDPPGTGGRFRYAQPTSGPARLDLAGTLALFGFDLAGTHAYFIPADGKFGFDSTVDIGFERLGVHGDVHGDVDLGEGTFYSEASLEGCVFICVTGKGVISDVGIAACVSIDLFVTSLEFLVGYQWQTGLTAGTTCDTGAFKTPPAGSQPAPDGVVVGNDGTIYAPPRDGVATYTVDIPGQGGVPMIRVHDVLQDETVSTDPAHPEEPQSTSHMALVPNPGTNSVRLVLINSAAIVGNAYEVTTLPGSVPIGRAARGGHARRDGSASFMVAESYAPTEVSASVKGEGRARKVVWTASHLTDSGRSLQFVETDADGLQHVLKETSAEAGTMPFTVADGKAGKRSIAAVIVNAQGVAIFTTPVATFTAPGYVLPAKAAKLKLALQKKDKLGVTWTGERSKSWLVLVTVEDGRRLRLDATKNAVTILGVSRKEKVTVTVIGVDGQGRRGKATTAKR